MSSQDPFPPLWRALGLSVAIGYAGLGSYAAFVPIQCATTYTLRSPVCSVRNDHFVKRTMAWIGARDISIAVALFAFYYQDKPREMGTLILSGVVLTTVDGITIWNARRDLLAASVLAGGAVWAWIGYDLVGL